MYEKGCRGNEKRHPHNKTGIGKAALTQYVDEGMGLRDGNRVNMLVGNTRIFCSARATFSPGNWKTRNMHLYNEPNFSE